MADDLHPWDKLRQWTDEEWEEEVLRRRATTQRFLAVQNAERIAARERRERWKNAVGDMSPPQIGDWFLELRRDGKTIAEVAEITGASNSTIVKYSKEGASYGG
jgi:MoxR-like ATPase